MLSLKRIFFEIKFLIYNLSIELRRYLYFFKKSDGLICHDCILKRGSPLSVSVFVVVGRRRGQSCLLCVLREQETRSAFL